MDKTLLQGSEEWLRMRKNHIGASDAPVIMKVSPWATPYELWEEKLDLRPDKKDNWGMKEGRNKEDQARLELEKLTGIFFLPQVKFHPEMEWMIASVDGIDPENKNICEIKCPSQKDNALASQGCIPEKYFPQLQHQLEVCQLDMVHYFSFDGTSGTLVKVYRDDKYIKILIEKEKRFWECMQDFTPPEMTEKDYISQISSTWVEAANEWSTLNAQIKFLEKRQELLRENIIKMSENKNCIGGGIKVTKIVRKGNVDYSLIPELKNIELNQFRKNPIECYKISQV